MQEKINLLNYEFEYVQELAPVKNISGQIKLFHPEDSFKNVKGLKLHKYGQGPFCRFSINPIWSGVSGVYAYYIDDQLCYIGQCLNFAQRFNLGYGNIQPRSCYEGGQPTNCKMNRVVLEAYQSGKKVDLYFHTTTDYDRIEYELIQHYNPKYNDARTSVPKDSSQKPKPIIPHSSSTQRPRQNTSGRSKNDVKEYILKIFQAERLKGNKKVVLRSGDIHKDFGLTNAMPTVCMAMYDLKKPSDRILHTTPSGFSSTIEIEYNL